MINKWEMLISAEPNSGPPAASSPVTSLFFSLSDALCVLDVIKGPFLSFLKVILFLIIYVYVCIYLCAGLCAHEYSACGDQKRMSDTVGLKLQALDAIRYGS